MTTKGTATTPTPRTVSEVIRVQRYERARFIRHRDTETYTGVPEPYEQPRVMVDKEGSASCVVRNTKGADVAVYSAQTGGVVLDTLSVGEQYTLTGRVWLESGGTSYVRIATT